MGYATIFILAFTAIALLFGTLFGMLRGRNRAILRLILMLSSIVLAIVFKDVIVDMLMDFNLGDGTLKEMLVETLTEGDMELPESVLNLIFALVEIIIGVIAYFILFIALRLITWMLLYPILKIFVKKGAKKRRGTGALVGLVQGILVAFTVCSPITGLMVQMDKLSKIEMDGEQIIPLPEELGIDEYANSTPGKAYNAIGGWYFEIISSQTDENGKKVSLNDACDVVVTVVGIANTVDDLNESMDVMTSETATPQERVTAMKDVGGKLIEVGNSIDGLSEDAKVIVDDLLDSVKDMISQEGNDAEEVEEIFADLNLENLQLVSAGEALNGVATYMEKTNAEFENNEAVTQEEVNAIVNGFADNINIFGLAGDGATILDVETEHAEMFETAIAGTDLSVEDKDSLRTLFGLA